MYSRILVALDGSEQAAAAIPHARDLGKLYGAPLTIVRVIRTPDDWANSAIETSPEIAETSQDVLASRKHDEERLESQTYLEDLRRSLEADGLKVDTVIPEGKPAEAILREATAHNADLIILTAYGRGGAHTVRERAVFGSVADAVLRETRAAVLVVRP